MIRDMPATPAERDRLVDEAIVRTVREYRRPSEIREAVYTALTEALWSPQAQPDPHRQRFEGVRGVPPPGQPGGAVIT